MLLNMPSQTQPLAVVAARGLRPQLGDAVNGDALVLPPRFALPARLWFRWLSAGHGAGSPDEFVETNSHPATTPVFG